jgi:hypothetical protein
MSEQRKNGWRDLKHHGQFRDPDIFGRRRILDVRKWNRQLQVRKPLEQGSCVAVQSRESANCLLIQIKN